MCNDHLLPCQTTMITVELQWLFIQSNYNGVRFILRGCGRDVIANMEEASQLVCQE